MPPGERSLTGDEQECIADIIKNHIKLDVRSRPKPLYTLDVDKKQNQEIVTKAVLSRHLKELRELFSAVPRAPPSRASLAPAICGGLERASEFPAEGSFQYSKDEAEKLCMIWRYVRDSLTRGRTSRDFALNTLKAIFLEAGDPGPAADEACEVGSSETEVEQEPPREPEPPREAPQPVPRRRLAKKASVVSLPDSVASSPPREPEPPREAPQPVPRRRLARKESLVSVASVASVATSVAASAASARTPKKNGPDRSLRSHLQSLAFAVAPPNVPLEMTPNVRKKVRFMTPAMKKSAMKKKKKKKKKVVEKRPAMKTSAMKESTAMKSLPTRMDTEDVVDVEDEKTPAMKTPAMKTSATSAMKTSAKSTAVGDDAEDETKYGPGFFIFRDEPAKDFANSAADRQWGADSLKTYTRALKIAKPNDPADHANCSLHKLKERKSCIVKIMKNRKTFGQVTLGQYKERIMRAANVLLFAAGAGYSEDQWGKVKVAIRSSAYCPAD